MTEVENTKTEENVKKDFLGIPQKGWLVIYVVGILLFTWLFDSFITEWKMGTGISK